MAKVKNSSTISASELKTTTKTKTFERLSNGVPYAERIKDSGTYFCWSEPFAFHVIGDAMLPQFSDGDTVIIDPHRKPVDDDFVVAGLPGQAIVFRKYACASGTPYQLLATNPQYAPLDPVLPVVGVMTFHHSKVDDRKEVERAIISLISSARSSIEDDDMRNEDPLLFASSQINTDFTLAAQCEDEGDLSMDDMDQGFFDLFRSPIYWKQREAFVAAAVAGDEYAFMIAVWRGYNAGKVSPDRFIPKMRKKRSADARGASKRDKGAADAK